MPNDLTAEQIAELVQESGDECQHGHPPEWSGICVECLRIALIHVLAREAVTERMLGNAVWELTDYIGESVAVEKLAEPHKTFTTIRYVLAAARKRIKGEQGCKSENTKKEVVFISC
jgi:hypothetical protein